MFYAYINQIIIILIIIVGFYLGGEKLNPTRIFLRTALLAVSFILMAFPVYAQNHGDISLTSPEETIVLGEALSQEAMGDGASVWIVLRMVLVLALAAIAIYGVVFFIKRLARPPQSKDPHLKILASVPLGGDSFAAVISVGNKAWLVGGGSGSGLSLISEIEEQEVLESMLLDEAQRSAESTVNRFPDFRSFLNRMGGGNQKPKEGGLDIHAFSLRKHRERLKGIGS